MLTPGKIRVAAAQYPIDQPASFAQWHEKVSRWVKDGAATGAELLAFPEYGTIELAAIRGPAVAADLAETLKAVAELSQDMWAAFAELAERHRVHVLAPSGPSPDGSGGYSNTARLFTPRGSAGSQDKLMMTPFERDWGIAPGHRLSVFDTALGRIGIAICYDSEFPLLVRAQAEAGADLILVPSCTERLSGYHRVRAGAVARALENGIATVVSPTVGDALWSPAVDRNVGAAGMFVPADASLSMTGVLAEGPLNEPRWVAADIHLDAIRRLRENGEMRNREDWVRQPGAAPGSYPVNVERLA